MPYILVAILLAISARAATAQVVLQNFESGLKYDECWAGDNVGLSSSGVPLEGQQRLQTGPLNRNKSAFYMSPYLTTRAGGFVRFTHRNESNGNRATPTLIVELVATDGSVGSTIYTYTHTFSTQPIVAQPQVPRDGTYRVRFRFVGDSGNERVGLDELNIDGTVSSSGPPQCGPVAPTVDPPVARPDAATSLAGASVAVNVVDNDLDRTYPIDRSTVDLQPENTTSVAHSRDIRDANGQLIGRAVADQNGLVTVTPVAGYTGTLTVPYSVRDTQGHVSNIALFIVTVRGAALDLQVLAVGPPAANVGETARYLTIIRNVGPGDAARATFTFVANSALGSLAASCPTTRALSCGTPQVSGTTVTIPITALPSGTAVVVSLTGIIQGGQGPIASVTSRIAAIAPDVDPVPGNDAATVNTQITVPPPGADVAVTITGPDSVVPGLRATYTTVVVNHGPGAASGVQLDLSADSGFVLESSSGACATTFPCALGTLAAGETRTVVTTYRTPVPSGTIVSLPPATITAQVQQSSTETDPANNTAAHQTQLNTSLDVAVAITPNPAEAPVGQPLEVFVLAANRGPNPARTFTVRVTLPSGATVISATPTLGTVAASGVWSLPEVAAGAQAELRIVVSLPTAGSSTMRATATPPPTDGYTGNDQADATLTAVASADLATRMTTTTPAPAVGTTATLMVYAGNLGPTAASDGRVALAIPPGLRALSATPPKGTFNAAAGVWSIGPLAPSEVIAMPMALAVDVAGTLPVTAVIDDVGLTFDPDLTNNTHTLAFGVTTSADLSVSLSADITNPVVGELVTLRGVVLNGGPSPATSTVVNFTAPPGAVTVVSGRVSAGTLGGGSWQVGTLPAGGRATLEAVIRVDVTGPIPITGLVGATELDPDRSNNTASLTLAGAPDYGQVRIDFEDLTGSESCWAWPGMAPGGLTANQTPFGRTQANPPLQRLVHLVSSQLSGGTNRLVSPWIRLFGAGAIRFTTKVTNVTSTPGFRVYLEDVATRTPVLAFDKTFSPPPNPDAGAYDTIPITVSGIYQVRWEFLGSGGNARAAIDDIVIDGVQAGDAGAPGQPVPPYDCRPIIPGNLAPLAVPDFATTPLGTPATVALLANDRDLDGSIVPDFVDLDPTGVPGTVQARDIYRADGVRLGRAAYNPATAQLTFAPEPGLSGTAIIPYTVTDNAGGVSNVSQVTILVGPVQADLRVTIAAPVTATAGEAVAYVMRVANLGPDGAVDAAVSHTFTNAGFQSVSCAVEGGQALCGSGATAGGTFTGSIPGLAPGAVVAYTLTATAPSFAGTMSGSGHAQVSAPVTDPVPANNTALAETIVGGPPPPPRADLAVTKVGPSEVAVGQRVRYVVGVVNLGPNDAAPVSVNDPTPPGFTLVGVTGACTSLACNLGPLGVGQNRIVVYEYVAGLRVPGVLSAPVTNVVTVGSSTPDPVPANNTAAATTRVYLSTDLSVTASQAPTSIVGVATPLVFTVANAGPSTARAVSVLVAIDSGLWFVSAAPGRGTFDPSSGVWTIGDLVASDVVDLRIVARPQVAGSLATTATITAGLEGDTDQTNNAASATTTVLASADIGLTSQADNTAPLAGDSVTFTLRASNEGPSDSSGVAITGVLPAGLTYLSHTTTQGTLDTATGVWSLGGLPLSASATLTVSVRVERSGAYNTSAGITAASEIDLNQSNNTTGVYLNAGAAADVGVEIVFTPTTADIGDTVAIRGTVTNHGPSEATNIAALYSLPAGVRVTGFTVTTGTAANGRWAIPSLAPGSTATLDATAILEQSGVLTITGAASHAEPDPNPVNNATHASINAVGNVDLRVSMVAGTPNPLISDNTTVFVYVTNEGNVTSAPVGIQLTRDAVLNPVSALASQGTYDIAAGRWTVGPVAAGGAAKLALVLRVTDAGLLRVTSQIVSPVLPPALARTAVASVTLEVFDSFRTVADLQLAMTATPRIDPAGVTTVTALAQNAGSTYALDLALSVAVPPGARFVSATPSFGAACTLPAPGASGTVQCRWPGQSVVGIARLRAIAVTAQADPGLPDGARLLFTGQVQSLTPDPYLANNAAQATTVITSSTTTADIAITKAFEGGATTLSVATGSVMRYRVTAINTGSAVATAVQVLEDVPAGFTVLSAVPSQGSLDAGSRTWSIGALAPGASATLDVALASGQPWRTELVSARVASSPVDANPINDRAAIVVDVYPATGGGRFVATGNIDGAGAHEIITGTGQYEPAQLRIFSGDGRALHTFYPYDPRFGGGVRVAACDIDADGRDEVVTAAGEPGGGPHIRVFKVYSADRIVELTSWYAFGEPYRGGVYVACGDVNGDGAPEVISGTGTIGEPTVLVWEVRPFFIRELYRFRPFTHQVPEARVAVCDLNGDGRHEILAASGPGAPAEVAAFDGVAGSLLGRLGALGGLATGAFVACGDLTPVVAGPELVVSADAGGPPVMQFYSSTGTPLVSVLAATSADNGGVRVAVGDVDAASPGAELLVGTGQGTVPLVRVVSGFGGVLVELRAVLSPNLP